MHRCKHGCNNGMSITNSTCKINKGDAVKRSNPPSRCAFTWYMKDCPYYNENENYITPEPVYSRYYKGDTHG